MRRLRRVGCPTVAASTVSARRACQRCALSARPERSPPAPLATPRATARRLHEHRGVPRLPRGHKNPRGSRLAVWVERARLRFGVARRALAGRLPARHRDFCDSGTGLRLSAPTSASADHAAGGSSVDGGILPPRHESLTRKILITILAAIGPKADFAACHYPFRTNPHPQRLPGSDRRQPRQARPRAVPTRAGSRRSLSFSEDTYTTRSLPSLSQSARRARASRTD